MRSSSAPRAVAPRSVPAVVQQICDASVRAALTAAGAYHTTAQEFAVANSLGVWGYHTQTQADINTVIMSETSSGYAARASKDVGDIDGEAVAREAVDVTLRGVNPRTAEPGEYEVLLSPYAAVDMLDFFSYLSFGALPFMEKRSFMSGRIGERVMGENVSIWDDGAVAGRYRGALRLRRRAEAACRHRRPWHREGRRLGQLSRRQAGWRRPLDRARAPRRRDLRSAADEHVLRHR